MGVSSNLFNVVRRKLLRKSHRTISIRHSPSPSQEAIIGVDAPEEAVTSDDTGSSSSATPFYHKKELTKEDIAAIKIQAAFRGHLAKRAFRALKSLIKVQALVRGVSVRRQSRIAMHCMHALVRLHVKVRARQLLSSYSDT